jgi:hypothetical protein
MVADFTPSDPVQPPSLVLNIGTMIGQHLLTGISGFLLLNGAISKDQVPQLMSLGGSLIVALIGVGWHYYMILSHRANANERVAQAKAS